jgi:hypothetical protein
MQVPNPQVMAVQSRYIGVTELKDKFVFDFAQAPVQPADEAIVEWECSVANQ